MSLFGKKEDVADIFPPHDKNLTGDNRTEARLCAVQAMYGDLLLEGLETASFPAGGTPNNRKVDVKLFDEIVAAVRADKARMVELISAHLTSGWTWERLDMVLRALLLAAVGELYARPETDAKLVVSEYVNLAAGFIDQKKIGFVNALLDSVSKKVRG